MESCDINVTFWHELHMAHERAGAFQQVIGIGNLGAPKKTDIDVSCEGIDIAERRIIYTRGRMTVMQQLSNIVSAVAHDFKPALRDRCQFISMLTHPDLNRWISLDRSGESKKWLMAISSQRRFSNQVANADSSGL